MTTKGEKNLNSRMLLIGGVIGIGLVAWMAFFVDWGERDGEKKEPKVLSIAPASYASEEKVFDDGTKEVTFYAYPKFYRDEKGELKETDSTIKESVEEGFDWGVETGVWQMHSKNDTTVLARHLGTELETKLLSLVYFDKISRKYAIIEKAKEVAPQVEGNRMTWKNVMEGVDYQITYVQDQLKEDIFMSAERRKNLPSPEDYGIARENAYLGFVFDVERGGFSQYKTFVNENGKRREVKFPGEPVQTEGNLEFENENGEVFEVLDAGFVAAQGENAGLGDEKRLPLLKSFFKDDGTERFFFSGTKLDEIPSLPEGNLIFDPTLFFRKGDGGSYSEIDDTYIENYNVFPNYSFGAATLIKVGLRSAVIPDNSLIKFPDIVGNNEGQIPQGATLLGANLVLNQEDSGMEDPDTIDLYKAGQNWTEGNVIGSTLVAGNYGATYNHAQNKYNSETAYINNVAGIDEDDTSVTVDNGSGGNIAISDWPEKGMIQIDNEIMWYTEATSTGFSGLIRGINGTTSAPHNDNDVVSGVISWSNQKGDLIESFSGEHSGVYAYNINVIDAVSDWVINPNSNYGFYIDYTVNAGGDYVDFYSSEHVDISKRPQLVVVFDNSQDKEAVATDAYESNDTAVSPSSPGTEVTDSVIRHYPFDGDNSTYISTADSVTDTGYDSQVFKFLGGSKTPLTITWNGHGEAAPTNNDVSLNVWNFDTGAWEEVASGPARNYDAVTDISDDIQPEQGNDPFESMALDTDRGHIYIGRWTGASFVRYDPETSAVVSKETKLNDAGIAYGIHYICYDPVQEAVYMAGTAGQFGRYNVATDNADNLASLLPGSWTANYFRAIDSDNDGNVFIAGNDSEFGKYDPVAGTVTDLETDVNWGAYDIYAMAYDEKNNRIYLGGEVNKFGYYDIDADSFTDLTTSITGILHSSTTTIRAMAANSESGEIYFAGGTDGTVSYKLGIYGPENGMVRGVDRGIPSGYPTEGGITYKMALDKNSDSLYLGGGSSLSGTSPSLHRYYLNSGVTERRLTNNLSALTSGTTFNVRSILYNEKDQNLYVGYTGNSDYNFFKISPGADTTLTAQITSNPENYSDEDGYVWVWVKAENEESAPAITVSPSVTPGETSATIAWTTDIASDNAVAFDTVSRSSWDDYAYKDFEDESWLTSHSQILHYLSCATTYYYRVRSCDEWGSCVVSGQSTFTTSACSSGSCPYLYTWNGNSFEFETDLYGSGGLAYQRGPNIMKPMPHRIYQVENVVPKNDEIEFRIVEDLDEIDYFDRFELLSYTVPENANFGINIPPFEPVGVGKPLVIHTIGEELTTPVYARQLDNGRDVTGEISYDDGKRIVLSEDSNNFDYHTLEMDFGDISKYPQKKLVIVGETVFPKSDEGIARRKNFPQAQYIEVINEKGEWEKVPDDKMLFSKPISFEGKQVFDISNIFLSDDMRIRITYAYKTHINQIAFDGTPDLELPDPEIIPIKSAELSYSGVYHKYNEDGEIPDYYETESNDDYGYYPGKYTKYGEVAELLEEQDDRFVIMSRGDEIALKFENPKSSVPEGYKRLYIADTWGYYKSIVSRAPLEVEKLPFAAMSTFPYPEEEYPYDDDPEYQTYLDEWNTRELGNGKTSDDYVTVSDRLDNYFEESIQEIRDRLKKSLQSKKEMKGEYTTHRSPGEGISSSANTDYITVEFERSVRIKGGTTLEGGVRLK
jgi:hypothetical protein